MGDAPAMYWPSPYQRRLRTLCISLVVSCKVDDGIVIIANMNMSSFPPSSHNRRREMVHNLWDLISNVKDLRDARSIPFSWVS